MVGKRKRKNKKIEFRFSSKGKSLPSTVKTVESQQKERRHFSFCRLLQPPNGSLCSSLITIRTPLLSQLYKSLSNKSLLVSASAVRLTGKSFDFEQ